MKGTQEDSGKTTREGGGYKEGRGPGGVGFFKSRFLGDRKLSEEEGGGEHRRGSPVPGKFGS